MKKRIFTVAAVISLLILAWLCNGLFGNPVSYFLAEKSAKRYVEENFSNSLHISKIEYDLKRVCYYARVEDPQSIDFHFSIYIDMKGKVFFDTSKDAENGSNTARRINTAYRQLTDAVFEDDDFPYECYISFGNIEIVSKNQLDGDSSEIKPYALVYEDLKLDFEYDMKELGKEAGHLTIYIETENISKENAAASIMNITSYLEKADVPFKAMDFILMKSDHPELKDYFWVRDLLYDEIGTEDFLSLLESKDKETKEYFAKMDSLKD